MSSVVSLFAQDEYLEQVAKQLDDIYATSHEATAFRLQYLHVLEGNIRTRPRLISYQ